MDKKDKNYEIFKKYDREKYDDVYKRKKFKDSYFEDKKIKKDYYTGEVIHSSSKAAKLKYGEKAYVNHSTDVDHIIPVKTVYNKSKKNPFLSDKDIKEIANDKSNYRITTSKYNRQKRDKSNLEVVFDKKIDLDINGRAKVATDHIKATANIKLNTGIKVTKNISSQFSDGAYNNLKDSKISLMSNGINNLVLVACGEKDFDEAAKEMAIYSSKKVVIGGAKEVTNNALNNMKSRVINSTENEILKNGNELLKIIANSNELKKIIEVGKIVGGSFIKYINGEINGEEFFDEIGQKGFEFLSSSIGAFVGQTLIPIPIIGAIIGSMIASFASGEIYKYANTLKDHKANAEKVERLANSALLEMNKQRQILKDIIRDELKVFDENVNKGFDTIYESMLSNDMEGVADGLNTILSVVNETVIFKNRNEFNDFFNDEDAILNL